MAALAPILLALVFLASSALGMSADTPCFLGTGLVRPFLFDMEISPGFEPRAYQLQAKPISNLPLSPLI
jgi:hypothetical protein